MGLAEATMETNAPQQDARTALQQRYDVGRHSERDHANLQP